MFPSLSRAVGALSLVGCLLALASGISASMARADAASGTYTGTLSLRGNYWWEDSTRVIAPSASVSIASPVGVRVEGSYLLDAITSASIATGVMDDQAFTEKRHEGHAGVGYEVDFGEQQLDLSASGRYSKEPDYLSRGAGFAAALSVNQRNTVLRLSGYFVDDDVYKLDRVQSTTNPNRLMARTPVFIDDLRVLSLGFAWDQVLNRSTTLTLGYDAAILNGFQANPYRTAPLADGPGRVEEHPDRRMRNAWYLWLAHFALATRTTFRLGYRFYHDNWDVLAHAPDVRVHQAIGPYVDVRLRYRYYTQSSSFFYRPGGNLKADRYATNDPKMSDFHDHTFGLKVRLALDFLAFTAFDALRTAVLDWSVEYVLNSNRYNNNKYGDGVIAQGGIGWSF